MDTTKLSTNMKVGISILIVLSVSGIILGIVSVVAQAKWIREVEQAPSIPIPGPDGPAGPPGAIGKDGKPGIPGASGLPGLTGSGGFHGHHGATGVHGATGEDGKSAFELWKSLAPHDAKKKENAFIVDILETNPQTAADVWTWANKYATEKDMEWLAAMIGDSDDSKQETDSGLYKTWKTTSNCDTDDCKISNFFTFLKNTNVVVENYIEKLDANQSTLDDLRQMAFEDWQKSHPAETEQQFIDSLKGKSAYDIWHSERTFTPREQDWLDSMIGPPGKSGEPGKGAYEKWYEHHGCTSHAGNCSAQAFLDSLVGPTGAPGIPGEQGSSNYKIWFEAQTDCKHWLNHKLEKSDAISWHNNSYLVDLTGNRLEANEFTIPGDTTDYSHCSEAGYLKSMQGPTGTPGEDGADGPVGPSALDIWKTLHPGEATGTAKEQEQKFIDSLIGPQGPTGAPGAPGATGVTGDDGNTGAPGKPGDDAHKLWKKYKDACDANPPKPLCTPENQKFLDDMLGKPGSPGEGAYGLWFNKKPECWDPNAGENGKYVVGGNKVLLGVCPAEFKDGSPAFPYRGTGKYKNVCFKNQDDADAADKQSTSTLSECTDLSNFACNGYQKQNWCTLDAFDPNVTSAEREAGSKCTQPKPGCAANEPFDGGNCYYIPEGVCDTDTFLELAEGKSAYEIWFNDTPVCKSWKDTVELAIKNAQAPDNYPDGAGIKFSNKGEDISLSSCAQSMTGGKTDENKQFCYSDNLKAFANSAIAPTGFQNCDEQCDLAVTSGGVEIDLKAPSNTVEAEQYYIHNDPSGACPDGQYITSVEDCEAAAAALKGSSWKAGDMDAAKLSWGSDAANAPVDVDHIGLPYGCQFYKSGTNNDYSRTLFNKTKEFVSIGDDGTRWPLNAQNTKEKGKTSLNDWFPLVWPPHDSASPTPEPNSSDGTCDPTVPFQVINPKEKGAGCFADFGQSTGSAGASPGTYDPGTCNDLGGCKTNPGVLPGGCKNYECAQNPLTWGVGGNNAMGAGIGYGPSNQFYLQNRDGVGKDDVTYQICKKPSICPCLDKLTKTTDEKTAMAFPETCSKDAYLKFMKGIAGAPGDVGPTGAPGLPGADGNTGAPGTDGNTGAPGRHGKDGKDGKDGPRGHTGAPGLHGDPGAKGPQGEPAFAFTNQTFRDFIGQNFEDTVTCPNDSGIPQQTDGFCYIPSGSAAFMNIGQQQVGVLGNSNLSPAFGIENGTQGTPNAGKGNGQADGGGWVAPASYRPPEIQAFKDNDVLWQIGGPVLSEPYVPRAIVTNSDVPPDAVHQRSDVNNGYNRLSYLDSLTAGFIGTLQIPASTSLIDTTSAVLNTGAWTRMSNLQQSAKGRAPWDAAPNQYNNQNRDSNTESMGNNGAATGFKTDADGRPIFPTSKWQLEKMYNADPSDTFWSKYEDARDKWVPTNKAAPSWSWLPSDPLFTSVEGGIKSDGTANKQYWKSDGIYEKNTLECPTSYPYKAILRTVAGEDSSVCFKTPEAAANAQLGGTSLKTTFGLAGSTAKISPITALGDCDDYCLLDTKFIANNGDAGVIGNANVVSNIKETSTQSLTMYTPSESGAVCAPIWNKDGDKLKTCSDNWNKFTIDDPKSCLTGDFNCKIKPFDNDSCMDWTPWIYAPDTSTTRPPDAAGAAWDAFIQGATGKKQKLCYQDIDKDYAPDDDPDRYVPGDASTPKKSPVIQPNIGFGAGSGGDNKWYPENMMASWNKNPTSEDPGLDPGGQLTSEKLAGIKPGERKPGTYHLTGLRGAKSGTGGDLTIEVAANGAATITNIDGRPSKDFVMDETINIGKSIFLKGPDATNTAQNVQGKDGNWINIAPETKSDVTDVVVTVSTGKETEPSVQAPIVLATIKNPYPRTDSSNIVKLGSTVGYGGTDQNGSMLGGPRFSMPPFLQQGNRDRDCDPDKDTDCQVGSNYYDATSLSAGPFVETYAGYSRNILKHCILIDRCVQGADAAGKATDVNMDSDVCKSVARGKENEDLIQACCTDSWKAGNTCSWDSAACKNQDDKSKIPRDPGEIDTVYCPLPPDIKPVQCDKCQTAADIESAYPKTSKFDPGYLKTLINTWQAETNYWTEIGAAQNCIGLCEQAGLTKQYGMTGATREFTPPAKWERDIVDICADMCPWKALGLADPPEGTDQSDCDKCLDKAGNLDNPNQVPRGWQDRIAIEQGYKDVGDITARDAWAADSTAPIFGCFCSLPVSECKGAPVMANMFTTSTDGLNESGKPGEFNQFYDGSFAKCVRPGGAPCWSAATATQPIYGMYGADNSNENITILKNTKPGRMCRDRGRIDSRGTLGAPKKKKTDDSEVAWFNNTPTWDKKAGGAPGPKTQSELAETIKTNIGDDKTLKNKIDNAWPVYPTSQLGGGAAWGAQHIPGNLFMETSPLHNAYTVNDKCPDPRFPNLDTAAPGGRFDPPGTVCRKTGHGPGSPCDTWCVTDENLSWGVEFGGCGGVPQKCALGADGQAGGKRVNKQITTNMLIQQGWAADDDFAQGGGSCAYFTEHMSSANSFCGNNPGPSQSQSKQKISPTPGYQSIQGNNQTASSNPDATESVGVAPDTRESAVWSWMTSTHYGDGKRITNHLNTGSFVPSVGAATPWHHPRDTSVSNANFGDDMRWNPTAHMIPGKAWLTGGRWCETKAEEEAAIAAGADARCEPNFITSGNDDEYDATKSGNYCTNPDAQYNTTGWFYPTGVKINDADASDPNKAEWPDQPNKILPNTIVPGSTEADVHNAGGQNIGDGPWAQKQMPIKTWKNTACKTNSKSAQHKSMCSMLAARQCRDPNLYDSIKMTVSPLDAALFQPPIHNTNAWQQQEIAQVKNTFHWPFIDKTTGCNRWATTTTKNLGSAMDGTTVNPDPWAGVEWTIMSTENALDYKALVDGGGPGVDGYDDLALDEVKPNNVAANFQPSKHQSEYCWITVDNDGKGQKWKPSIGKSSSQFACENPWEAVARRTCQECGFDGFDGLTGMCTEITDDVSNM